jgi:hypothetical protein
VARREHLAALDAAARPTAVAADADELARALDAIGG